MENDPGRQLVRGHAYSNIISQDQAQVHIGDKHNYGDSSTHNHTYYLCASSSELSSQFLTLCGHGGIVTNEGEQLTLKRRRSSNENEHKHKLDREESLEHALSKLGKFSKSIQDQKIGKDAKKIVRRIGLAIDAIKKQQAGPPGHSSAESYTYMSHDKGDLKNIRKNLKIARRVDINTGFRRTQNTKLAQVIRKYDKIAFEQWEISLKTLIVESRDSEGSQVVDSFITLYLKPRIPGSGLPVAVHFGESRTHTGVSFINPVILAYRVVSYGSEVFRMIENDDLEGLKTLLADGVATLRDCEHNGATLLHCACQYHSLTCCQYLVDKGADIESIATGTYLPGTMTPLYLCAQIYDPSLGRDTVQCGKILLNSGADPTIVVDRFSTPVSVAVRDNPKLLDSILVEGTSFLDLKNFRQNGFSLWLNTCESAHRSASWILQRLKDAGCNIAEKDGYGWNCLFHSVFWSNDPGTSYALEKLQYLLSIFDEIHARDVKGCTIFDHVHDLYKSDYRGSYICDLWYCALERSGFDVSSHRNQRPRVASYRVDEVREYTPEHYHALKHLQSWDEDNFRSQMDRLLQEIPLDEDEALEMERIRWEKSEVERLRRERLDMLSLRWQGSDMDYGDESERGNEGTSYDETLLDLT